MYLTIRRLPQIFRPDPKFDRLVEELRPRVSENDRNSEGSLTHNN